MSKAQTKATNRYKAKNYDRLAIEVKKGQREVIKAYAESQGKSLNAYINDLIAADMAAHGQSLPPSGISGTESNTD